MIGFESQETRDKVLLDPAGKIKQAVELLNDNGLRIVLVADLHGKLKGVITDGDIRRALIKGVSLDREVGEVIQKRPLVVTPDVSNSIARQIMVANGIQHLPVVNAEGELVGLHLLEDLGFREKHPEKFVIMAGGKGTRLWPHTQNCPKPMLPVNDKPMLQHIIERAREDGFQNFVLAVNYLGKMIEEHFGNGERFDVNVSYIRENMPLGTAGALSLMENPGDLPIIVTNGDVLTDVKYSEILDFHNRYESDATMAVRQYEWQHPFGVVKTSGMEIVGFEEKPVSKSHINAGIYILRPEVLNLLRVNEFCDMPGLFLKCQNFRKKTMAYPMHEPWLDVGRPVDLETANDSSFYGKGTASK